MKTERSKIDADLWGRNSGATGNSGGIEKVFDQREEFFVEVDD